MFRQRLSTKRLTHGMAESRKQNNRGSVRSMTPQRIDISMTKVREKRLHGAVSVRKRCGECLEKAQQVFEQDFSDISVFEDEIR